MTEYWLQKKMLAGWSVVTWYDNLEQAQENYKKCLNNIGYSWRLVKVETVECQMLDEVTEVKAPEIELVKSKSKNDWGASTNLNDGWSTKTPFVDIALKQASDWSNWKPAGAAIINPGTGSDGRGAKPGSVCLMHHGLKKRMRAMPNEVDVMIAQGWERGGPRTQFRC